MVNSDAMIEAPQRPGFSNVKEAVKLRRLIKELSHEEGIKLHGSKGKRLEGILDNADLVLSDLQEEHKDWIEQKRQLFTDYLAPVKPDVVEERYRSGLAITIKQEFRTYGKVSKAETLKLDDPKYLKSVITGYTVDFLRSLHLSQRLGVNPNIALDIARLSYHHDPTKLTQLVRQYPTVNLSVLERAALSYPKNPGAFLDGFIKTIARLSADDRYKSLNPSVLERAALHNSKNPEGLLDGFIANVARLSEDPRFSALNPSVLERAALYNPKNPGAFLDGFIKTIARLSADDRYKSLNPSVLERAALYNPKNPEGLLDGFIANVARLSEDPRYSALNPRVITLAALSYPKNPEGLLDGFIKTIARLSADDRYKSLNPSVLERAALYNPKNPEGLLDGFIANVAGLKLLYPDLPASAITNAALNWPNKPEIYLDKIKRREIVPQMEVETILPTGEELYEEEITLTDNPIGTNGDV